MAGTTVGEIRARLVLDMADWSRRSQQARSDMDQMGRSSANLSKQMGLIQKASLAVGGAVVAGIGVSVKKAAVKSDTVGALTEILEPVKETAKEVAATAIEAKDRADASNETIGLFGLLRMLKDPQAQKLFRFANSYLEIMNEKQK